LHGCSRWWASLEYRDALCRGGTKSRAALELRVNKATVSRRIAELERAAPPALFERRGGAIELTPYGRRAMTAFRAHEDARKLLQAELETTDVDARGSVRLTMPSFFACSVVVPALPAFLRSHRHVAVQVEGTHRIVDLARDEADIAIRNVRPTQSSLSLRKAGRIGLSAYASKEYLAERGKLLKPHCMQGHDLICYDSGPYAGPGFEWLPEAAQHARVAFSANDAMALRDAVSAGLGIGVLPHLLGDQAKHLRRVDGGGEGVTDIWIVTRAQQRNVRRVRAVVQFLAELIQREQPRLYAPQ